MNMKTGLVDPLEKTTKPIGSLLSSRNSNAAPGYLLSLRKGKKV
jgi:hypothetical protein